LTPQQRWTELVSKTVSDALNAELERRGMSMKDAAREMSTTVQNVSRWAHPGLAVEPDGDQIDALMDFLGLDERDMGALVIATKRRRAEMRRSARRRGL
jgi:transcriptional regulator with XRE-family HTH domain